MPEISRFYGIIIRMFGKDHNPPHFHVKYGEFNCKIDIKTGELIEGELPSKQLRLVQAWFEIHNEELINNWEEGQKDNPKIIKIEPLK